MRRHTALLVTDEDELLCPYCGIFNTHMDSALIFKGTHNPGDSEEILGMVGGEINTSKIREERDRLTIRIHCENGHSWHIHMQQHKGCTIISHEEVR